MSENQKSRLMHYIWGMVAAIGGNDVELSRSCDPLHKRYDVNKYGIIAHTKHGSINDYEAILKNSLIENGFSPEDKKYYLSDSLYKKDDQVIYISGRTSIKDGEKSLYVSI